MYVDSAGQINQYQLKVKKLLERKLTSFSLWDFMMLK